MFEIRMVLLTLATMALGLLVWYLFEQKNEIRASFESRLSAIESLEGPFARKLADEGPTPLKRVLSLGIHLDARFWGETLQLTPVELDEIRTKVRLHDVLSKDGPTKDLDTWFYGDIVVHIQEWRGGYMHIKVNYPFCHRKEPTTIELYHGRSTAELWRFDLPACGERFRSGALWLEWDGHSVTLSAGSQFGWHHFVNIEPAPPDIFLAVPLHEGPLAEQYYFAPDRKVQTLPDAFELLPPWERCYEHLDLQKGLAWRLWIQDCDLFTCSQGNGSKAQCRLLTEWRERFAWDDAGKEWYRRVARSFEDAEATERAELTKWSAAREQSWKCQCGAEVDRTEFQEACPNCGKRFS